MTNISGTKIAATDVSIYEGCVMCIKCHLHPGVGVLGMYDGGDDV